MIQKIFTDLEANNFVVVSKTSIHMDGFDHGEQNLIEKINGGYLASHSVSGGRNECVWNTYEEAFDSFIEALKWLHEIEFFIGVKSYEELDHKLEKNIMGLS